MAVPKRRTSKSKRDSRRSHDSLSTPPMADCPNCGEKRAPHRACAACGHYKGRAVAGTQE
ncbi:MAG TPA: 50S ribosomal protein L32 [Deltaproteobacteria bacterium]|nr:50S ribosomal protein L32 [Candidatus Binatota bacterium]HIL13815.1 50S ribosomal protein L32 [Deltaproteobacteria bacterium]